jgi:hypothetical protein
MMKNTFLRSLAFASILSAVAFSACIDEAETPAGMVAAESEKMATATADSANFTTVQWIDSVKDLGSIREGEKLEVSFRFRNAGQKPLIVQSVSASCGCTVPEKPEKPLMAGEEGVIKAVFDSKGRPGMNHKTISVMTNTTGTTNHTLEFNVNVIGEKEGPKATNEQAEKF